VESIYRKKNLVVCLIIIAAVVVLTGLFSIYKYKKISNEVQSILTNEASLIYGVANSISTKESSVDDLVNFLKEKFIRGNYTSNSQSINKYIDNVDWYLNSMVSADKSIHGAWFNANPDLFIKLDGKKITLQDYSFTSWYYRDMNGEVIKGPRTNKRITPEEDPYYFEAVRVGNMIITQIYEDPDTKIEMVSIASPFFDTNGLLIGVAGIDITKSRLIEAFNNIRGKSNSSEVYIFDSEGKYVIGTKEPLDKLTSYVKKTKNSVDAKSSSSKIVGGNWILIEDQNSKGPYLVAEVPLSKISGNLYCILYTLYGLSIILFICLVLLSKKILQMAPSTIQETPKQN